MNTKRTKIEKLRFAFLSLPGLCTGDIFHTASAQILWTLYPRVLGVKMITLITIPEDAGPRVLDEHFGLVPAMYSYFTSLKLPVVVAKIPAMKDGDEENYERAAAQISGEQLKLLMASQNDQREVLFLDLWLSLDTLILDSDIQGPKDSLDSSIILPPLHHYAATTIATSYFNDDVSSEAKARRLNSLREGLSGHLTLKDEIYQDATEKIHKLKALVAKARTLAGPGFEKAKVILFVYRLIYDGPQSMNPHQDATPCLVSQVRSLARSNGLLTIRVPHGGPAQLLEDGDLDIFDVADPTQSRLKDKRYAPNFWSQISQMTEIFGAIGSRTGSLDIAAFCGVRCFEWDEPLLYSVQKGEKRRHSQNYLDRQIPQHLRLLTQASLLSIGLLDPNSFDPESERYKRICDELLKKWFEEKVNVFPKIPSDADIQEVVNRSKDQFLERKELDVQTYFPSSLQPE